VEDTYNGKAEDKGPHTGHGIVLGGLPDTHLVLAVLAMEGIAHQVLVNQDLGLVDILLSELVDVDFLGRHLGKLDELTLG